MTRRVEKGGRFFRLSILGRLFKSLPDQTVKNKNLNDAEKTGSLVWSVYKYQN